MKFSTTDKPDRSSHTFRYDHFVTTYLNKYESDGRCLHTLEPISTTIFSKLCKRYFRPLEALVCSSRRSDVCNGTASMARTSDTCVCAFLDIVLRESDWIRICVLLHNGNCYIWYMDVKNSDNKIVSVSITGFHLNQNVLPAISW
jgi:hypothetical protein